MTGALDAGGDSVGSLGSDATRESAAVLIGLVARSVAAIDRRTLKPFV